MSDTLTTLRFSLPWPPSVNTYWRHIVLGGKFKKARAQVILSEAGRRYRTEVLAALREQRVPKAAVHGRLAVLLIGHPPDRRERDPDNWPKGLLDALVHGGIIRDDSDIDDLHIKRGPVQKGGRMIVAVSELGEFNYQAALALPEAQTSATPF